MNQFLVNEIVNDSNLLAGLTEALGDKQDDFDRSRGLDWLLESEFQSSVLEADFELELV